MWAIRILSGPQAGQVFPLKAGKHRIGRAPSCEVKLASNSVSKEHASILATDDKLILTDLNSRNGTFVNGTRIQMQRLAIGDKVVLHDVICDIMQIPDSAVAAQPGPLAAAGNSRAATPAWAGNAADRLQHQQSQFGGLAPHDGFASQSPDMSAGMSNSHNSLHPSGAHGDGSSARPMSSNSLGDVFYNLKIYFDNVALPAVYGLVKMMEFRWALAALVMAYIFVVTTLSIVPVVTTTRDNIRAESVRRAKTIARHMRDTNKRFLSDRNEVAMDVRSAELEEGVTAALIINAKDGTILAPTNKRGEYANRPFVNKARRDDVEVAEFIDDSTVGVAVPISFYNPETGNQSAAAFAIVIYDSGTLAMGSDQVLSLYIQTLAIALLAGLVLFYLLAKIVEHPLEIANLQLDDALREGRDDIRTEYRFNSLEKLLANVNSALSRIGQSSDPSGALSTIANRDREASNVIRMLINPAIAINAIDNRIVSANPAFDQLVGGGLNLEGRPVADIPDSSLQQQIADLIQSMRAALGDIAIGEIPFPDGKYEICGQAILGASEPVYYLITLNKIEMGD